MPAFEARIGRGTLGNKAASGTAIIDELGPEHIAPASRSSTRRPTASSRLPRTRTSSRCRSCIAICEIAFELAARGLGVGRVIARPFVGESGRLHAHGEPARLRADAVRADAARSAEGMPGMTVIAIGKIEDLFAGRGVTRAVHTTSDEHGMDEVEAALASTPSRPDLRQPRRLRHAVRPPQRRGRLRGEPRALRRAARARCCRALTPRDLLVVTADHGNDPTTPSTDHSREHVPVFAVGRRGRRRTSTSASAPTFADLGQTLAELFGVGPLAHGTASCDDILAGDVSVAACPTT